MMRATRYVGDTFARLAAAATPVTLAVMAALLAASCGDEGVAPEFEPASVVVTPASVSLAPGSTVNLAVSVLNAAGRMLSGVPVEFASSRPTVATVDPSGLVTAVTAAPDTATITVRVPPNGPFSEVPVAVHYPAAGIEILPATLKLRPGTTAQIAARVFDTFGTTIPGLSVTFASLDASVAAVSTQGLVTAGNDWDTTRVVARYVSPGGDEFVASAPVAVGPFAASPTVSSRPFGLAVSSSGTVYITRLDTDVLGVMALPGSSVGTGPTVGSVPTNVVFDAAGTTAYVTNQNSQSVGVIDVASGVQTKAIAVGADPFALALEPAGARLFVTTNANEVVVIDLAAGSVEARIPVDFAPNGIAFHPAQPVAYVSSMGAGTLSEISTATLSVTKVLAVGGVPQALAFAHDGAELYVADESGGYVRIVDPGSGTVIGSVPTGAGAFDLRLTADGTHLLVGLPWSGEVVLVDRAARSIVGRVSTGGVPRRIGCSADGTFCLVANESGWVDVLEF